MPDLTRRRLGRSELLVHPLCLGGNTFGWTTGRDESIAVLDAYAEAGGNFIDTADVYSAWIAGTAEASPRRSSASGSRSGGRGTI